ncbi:MAG: TrmH family RNA methyltransferase [Treponema sp.]|nr:TrmH family RNA methyltransferase [Treponema sp.]
MQKLRKIAKYFTFAENRLFTAAEKHAGIFSGNEFIFFADAARLLAEDTLFKPEARMVFTEAAGVFTGINQSCKNCEPLLRSLNNVKHVLLAETGREQADWDFTNSDGKLDSQKRRVFEGMYVYMEDIRSPFNVGAMFRTAESFGAEKIILSPLCADPNHTRAQRTAMGCIDIVPWERRDLLCASLPDPVFALETGGIPLDEFPFPRRGILITGSEELGVSPRVLAAADASLGRVSIPCCGSKASLNVSVAFGIAMQAWHSKLQTAW